MDIAIIENGVVKNAIVVEPEIVGDTVLSAMDHARLLLPGAEVVELPAGAGIGWVYDGKEFTPPGAAEQGGV